MKNSCYTTQAERQAWERCGFMVSFLETDSQIWSAWAFKRAGRFYAVAETEAEQYTRNKRTLVVQALSEDTAMERLRLLLNAYYEEINR